MATPVPCATLLLFLCSVQGLCPNDWTLFRGSCYYLFEDKEDWTEAVVLCLSHIAHLVIIETSEENRFLEDLVKKQVNRDDVWIGANDMMDEGVWRWTGSGENVTFTDWAHGEPDNWGSDQNCATIRPDYGYKWEDNNCNVRSHYICETSSVDSIVG